MEIPDPETEVPPLGSAVNKEASVGIHIYPAGIQGAEVEEILFRLHQWFYGDCVAGPAGGDDRLKLHGIGQILQGLLSVYGTVVEYPAGFIGQGETVDRGVVLGIRSAVIQIKDVKRLVCLKGLGPDLSRLHRGAVLSGGFHMLVGYEIAGKLFLGCVIVLPG